MRVTRIITSNIKKFSILYSNNSLLISPHVEQQNLHYAISTIKTAITNPFSSNFPVPFSSTNLETPPKISNNHEELSSETDHSDSNNDDDDDDNIRRLKLKNDDSFVKDVKTVVNVLNQLSGNPVEMKNKIEQCGVKVTHELVTEVLSRVRNDWEAAFTFFLWAGKQPGYSHSVSEYHSMISILAKMRKFDTAWSLIDEMRGVKTGISLVTPQTLLIMIRRYCAVHDVARAINTFYAYKRFKFDRGIDEFQSLLSALCRYKNVQDAEHLMFCNKDVFPFNTKSFNIVLNGWCNVIGSPREAERVWGEMCKRRISYDVVSYASIISCYSKAGNLYKVLKLYDRIKEMGIQADRKVYNAVIHALAKGRHVKEAINLMKTMEENGITPNTVTYNSLIRPLCKAQKLDEARGVFDEMLQRGHSPTVQTYHAFFRKLRTGDEVFALLKSMRKIGCQPIIDTYIMLIRKFCRWRQFDDVFKVWNEMSENGIGPDRSSYIVLIHGLFLNGKLEEAYKYYADMLGKHLLPEPKIDEMLQTWFSNKQIAECQVKELKGDQFDCSPSGRQNRATSSRFNHEKDFIQQTDTRTVVRERGFSLGQ
ncbi:pentatricopeptide repeat-containing protein At5g15010, mitochondrial [Mercurialis annua]|uniref:pentatricopeptide repeat-containing protein At5g15010, mitochondrial n=1 Tax=Mercurialis annua TaxID=3986 RepID=UPI00215E49A9|nr:pentatricopeptide repeat-containing protein At5g15010, mitochondrial [Mercurialis annua]XP_055961250.1 pentatricopeptide repeat-containing protein At5g15010, mitochondrial [Mercurialis annua]